MCKKYSAIILNRDSVCALMNNVCCTKIAYIFPYSALSFVVGMSAICLGNNPQQCVRHALHENDYTLSMCWSVHGAVDEGAPGTLGFVGP